MRCCKARQAVAGVPITTRIPGSRRPWQKPPGVQVGDFPGRWPAESLTMQPRPLIVAGVRFMGETSKIYEPHKRVLMPTLEAEVLLDLGCPIDQFSAFCDAHPESHRGGLCNHLGSGDTEPTGWSPPVLRWESSNIWTVPGHPRSSRARTDTSATTSEDRARCCDGRVHCICAR